jgi:hypothetical protein
MPMKVKKQMGIFSNSFEKWVIQTRILAQPRAQSGASVSSMTAKLIAHTLAKPKDGQVVDVKAAKGYQRVMGLFDGEALGADMAWLYQMGLHQRGHPMG